jgi:hypothetical protein
MHQIAVWLSTDEIDRGIPSPSIVPHALHRKKRPRFAEVRVHVV